LGGQVPQTGRGKRCHESIRTWVLWLLANRCFCPSEYDRPFDVGDNVSCYISSPGNEEGGVGESQEVKNILRYTMSERGAMSPTHMVGKKVWKGFGNYLTRYCHFGPESSIMDNMLEKLQSFVVDLRPIMDCSPVYDAKKHIEKLGLQGELPGLCKQAAGVPDNFIRLPVVWKSCNGGIGSEGAGVNMFTLLSAAALVGSDHVHCKASSRFAQAVIKQMLKKAPKSVGDAVAVRSFNDQTRKPEYISVGFEGRPDHFMRPLRDDCFAYTGVFSVCPAKDGKMPEDYACCGAVEEQAEFLCVEKYADMPPEHVQGHYQLIPGRYYALYGKDRDVNGNILVGATGVTVMLDNNECFSESHMNWQERLKEENLLVLPMVWRSGALISLDEGTRLGCLVPTGTRESMVEEGCDVDSTTEITNYNHVKFGYNVLVSEEEPTLLISTLDVLDHLVAPGTFVWIQGDTQAWHELSEFLPPTGLDEEMAGQRAIRARLNVPLVANPVPGKVYVTVMQRSSRMVKDSELDYRHVVVDPWELRLAEPEDEELQVTELIG